MKITVEKAIELKQALVDFVYDAEGEIAIALETFAAERSKKNASGIKQQNIIVDLFISEGKIGDKTLIETFLDQNNGLSKEERDLLRQWQHNIIGLFEIKQIVKDSYQLMNWLTAKIYRVYRHSGMPEKEIKRWQPGEILLTIIAPLNEGDWFFFSDRIVKGKLSQPKLAVAVGEFRELYPEFLYADAPESLAQAWESVAIYHREFVDHFGSDRLSLPGYQLNQKIGELQKKMSQKKLTEAGIDTDKSLSQMLSESGTDETEFAETATEMGADAEAVDKLVKNKDKLSMVTPKVELPPEIKDAELVTVFSDPKWGQMFLPNWQKFTDLLARNNLEKSSENSTEEGETALKLVQKYLQQPEANYYVWQQLKHQYPSSLQTILQEYTSQSNFDLDADLDNLLLKHDKSATPELPAIANIPIHLNDLFEAAVARVQKSRSKNKKKKKGFFNL